MEAQAGWLSEALASLTPRQRFVVERSWGLGGHSYSFREIAEAMGIEWQVVQRCYYAAMRAIRRYADGCQLEGIYDAEDLTNHGPWFLYGTHDGIPGIEEPDGFTKGMYYLEWWDK